MLNINQLIGFGDMAEDTLPDITYSNTWGISNNSASSTSISGVALPPGSKKLMFGIMQSANGGFQRNTTGMTINGIPATLRAQASNAGYEYFSHMSFWEAPTTTDTLVNLVITRTGGGSTHGVGVARMWIFSDSTTLGPPADTLVRIYTNTSGTIDKHAGGVVLALSNGFNGSSYISGIANPAPVYWVNTARHEVPITTTLNAPVSYGVVTQYYNQMMLAVSWLP